MENLQHRLAAVWFADIVGFTRQTAQDEGRALRIVQAFQEAARDVARRYDGRIVKFIGDAALAEFSSTESAVRAAIALTAACAEHASRAGIECPTLRIAVHVGDVATTEDDDVYGDGVNITARIVKEVAPGEVWVSEDVWRQLRQRPRFLFEARGTPELKGLEPVELYAVFGKEGEAGEERAVLRVGTRARALVRRLRRRRARTAVVALVLLTAVATWGILRLAGPNEGEAGGDLTAASATLDPSRVAVLYFEDHSPNGELGHLASGFTEGIIHQLSGIEDLQVVSAPGIAPFRDSNAPMDSIARVLGAGLLVNGSVARSGERLRINVQLVDGRDLSEVDSWTEERPLGELFALQDEVVSDIAGALRQRLGERIRPAVRQQETQSVEAWELVERAERLAFQAKLTDKEDSALTATLRRQADSLLARAENLDPNWIAPLLLRAEIELWAANPEAYDRSLDHINRALTKKPGNPRALAVRGAIYDSLASMALDSVTAARHLAAAQRDLRTAVASDPQLASAWIALADLLYNDLWDLAEARSAAKRAYDTDAFLLEKDHFAWLCEISFQLKDYAEVKRWCGEGRRRFPDRGRLVLVELYALASEGVEPNAGVAWRLVDEMGRQEFPEFNVPAAKLVTAAVLARAGQADSARAVVREARRAAPEDLVPYLDYFEARVRLLLGERAQSIQLLRSFLTVAPMYRAQVARDHWFESLAGEAAFERIVDRRRLPIFCRLLCEKP